ncbi:MAG: glycosyltransferase family 4 protein [Moritella sp.]|uniref:glycosyltransferase family 4 protein n=1 Tax=Moritella sp. TaxID=78556 RepID=UPI001E0E289D|nr:glycosyltransferase family 4 protein [Moritella sp.]NQZ48911.1 glycosyltransferase family 4 protein [Moritella sp.]
MKKVICVVQLPPPIHGAAILNEKVISMLEIDEGLSLSVLRLNYADSFEKMHASKITKSIYSFFVFFSYIKKLTFTKPDFVYISFSPFGAGLYRDVFISLLANFFGVKVKAHLHGTGLKNVKSGFKKQLYKFFFNRVELILISKDLYDDVSGYVDKKNVKFINNVVDTPVNHVEESPNVFNFLFMANLDRRKGALKVIDIFADLKTDSKFKESKLHIVGADTFFLKSTVVSEYIVNNHSHLADSIIIHGAKYGKEKEDIFLKCHIFIYPTEHDAAPLVVLEAQSYGLPVISSSQGALMDMLEHDSSGFIVDTYSLERYRFGINKVIDNYENFRKQALKIHVEKNSNQVLKYKLKELFYD